MMSKLSGILPANNRILSTDISKAQPLRAGAPRFWGGAPEMSAESTKSILPETAMDRINWSPIGQQAIDDIAIPTRADDLQFDGPSGASDLTVLPTTPSYSGPIGDMTPSGQQLDIRA